MIRSTRLKLICAHVNGVRNTGEHQTFSLAGVLITFCVESCFVIISWILDWAVGFARRPKTSKHPWRETARVADNKLQLLRKNLLVSREESNASENDLNEPWDDIEDSMPIAMPGVRLIIPQHKGGDDHYHNINQLGFQQVDSLQPNDEDEAEDSELEHELEMEHRQKQDIPQRGEKIRAPQNIKLPTPAPVQPSPAQIMLRLPSVGRSLVCRRDFQRRASQGEKDRIDQ